MVSPGAVPLVTPLVVDNDDDDDDDDVDDDDDIGV